MWRSSLWLSNRLLLLVTFNPHWILSKPGIFVFFRHLLRWCQQVKITFLGKLSKNGPENDVLSESNERSAKDEKEKKEDAKRTPHPYFHFWFPLWTILISKSPFWDTGTQPSAHRRGFSQCQFLTFPFLVPISQSNNGQATLHNLKHEFNFWGFNSSLGRPVNRSWSHIFWENLTLNAFPSDRGIIWSANSNVSRNIVLLVHCLDNVQCPLIVQYHVFQRNFLFAFFWPKWMLSLSIKLVSSCLFSHRHWHWDTNTGTLTSGVSLTSDSARSLISTDSV